jgi:hypothetical protein
VNEITFALIKNDVVLNNIISNEIDAGNIASDIGAQAVNTTGLPVQCGDDYTDGEFYRAGKAISAPVKAKKFLSETDVLFGARGVEDLIDILVSKNVISLNDLPSDLATKLEDRKLNRDKL